MAAQTFWSDSLEPVSTVSGSLGVSLSNELATILSSQLYSSPLKAIEELVVNSYDADAPQCNVFVPDAAETTRRFVVVFDDGTGMDAAGLQDLWHIGNSKKRDADIEKRAKRKQIGKFGIGKLATYTIANKLTYVSKRGGNPLFVTLDFSQFRPSEKGQAEPISLDVRTIHDWDAFIALTFRRSSAGFHGVFAAG